MEKSARQQAELALLEKQQILVELEHERTHGVIQAREQLRQDLEHRHKCEMDAQLELIGMLNLQRYVHSIGTLDASVGQINNNPPSSDNQGLNMHTEGVNTVSLHHDSDPHQSAHSTHPVQHTDLPPLSMFNGKEQDNGNAFDRWSRKLHRYAELQQWTQDVLLQFELHLMGRAEEIYDMLPKKVKHSCDSAMSALWK